jgi:hypothetical protein
MSPATPFELGRSATAPLVGDLGSGTRSPGLEIAAVAVDAVRTRRELVLENAVLRHQVNAVAASVSAAAWGNDVHTGWRGQQPSSCVCQADSLIDLRKIAKFHTISTHHPAGTAPDGRRAAGAWQPSSRVAPLEQYTHGPHRDHALFIQHLVEDLGACRRARRHRPPRSRRQIRRQVQVRSVDPPRAPKPAMPGITMAPAKPLVEVLDAAACDASGSASR